MFNANNVIRQVNQAGIIFYWLCLLSLERLEWWEGGSFILITKDQTFVAESQRQNCVILRACSYSDDERSHATDGPVGLRKKIISRNDSSK